MHYESYTLPNGLRIIHQEVDSQVAYCGFGINAGTRDELPNEYGMAHFVEHMLFKGTSKRKPYHIINRMENVGGELNAYTTKEETFIYSVFLNEDFDRAIELLSDLVFNSQFPENELSKEREVVLDEINSYKDNPSELIFDDFENLIFSGHEIGHNILGEEETLKAFDQKLCLGFFKRFYVPSNMVFFSVGKMSIAKVIKLVAKYTEETDSKVINKARRTRPQLTLPRLLTESKELHQTHVMIGGRGYETQHENRLGLYLLNNILGGPGMNSRLNLALREKHGLVYSVESGLTSYTDTGIFTIYFGCDNRNADKCLDLTYTELKRITENKLTETQLSAAKKQIKGQLGIGSENRENRSLSMGKNYLHYNKFDSLQSIYERIDALKASQLLEIANEVLNSDNLSQLIYK